MVRESKEAAEYTPHGTEEEHCEICEHFLPPDDCEIVWGDVVKGGWCRHFKAKGKAKAKPES